MNKQKNNIIKTIAVPLRPLYTVANFPAQQDAYGKDPKPPPSSLRAYVFLNGHFDFSYNNTLARCTSRNVFNSIPEVGVNLMSEALVFFFWFFCWQQQQQFLHEWFFLRQKMTTMMIIKMIKTPATIAPTSVIPMVSSSLLLLLSWEPFGLFVDGAWWKKRFVCYNKTKHLKDW